MKDCAAAKSVHSNTLTEVILRHLDNCNNFIVVCKFCIMIIITTIIHNVLNDKGVWVWVATAKYALFAGKQHHTTIIFTTILLINTIIIIKLTIIARNADKLEHDLRRKYQTMSAKQKNNYYRISVVLYASVVRIKWLEKYSTVSPWSISWGKKIWSSPHTNWFCSLFLSKFTKKTCQHTLEFSSAFVWLLC